MKVQKELDFVYICTDGKRFLLIEEAEKHQQELDESGDTYKIFNN